MAVERVRFLDSGSLVIDRSHVMWNIDCGNPVRFPVYSVLIEHSDGLFLFDSGYDKGTVEEFLAFELPEQTEEQTIPAQLEKCGFAPGRRDRGDQLAPALRSLSAASATCPTR